VKTDSLSKTQLLVRTKCIFCYHLRETCVKPKKQSFMKAQCETLKIQIL